MTQVNSAVMFQVARRGAKYGMLAPQLIQLEEEIDAEIAGEEFEPPEPPVQRKTVDLMSLDEMVSHSYGHFLCIILRKFYFLIGFVEFFGIISI